MQFMLLTAGTLQNRKCTFVNVIEMFAVYNTVSITDCLINTLELQTRWTSEGNYLNLFA